MQSLVVFISIFNAIFCPGHGLSSVQNELLEQPLTPYVHKHGSRLTHRSIQECHKEEYGSPPHEVYPAHVNVNLSEPFIQVKRFVKELTNSFPRRTVRGHYVLVSNPLKTLSVLEPDQPGGCSLNIRQTVSATSKKHKCTVAINAGYFDTTSGKCLGNVISNGRIAHDSNGIQNAHFGLTKDGKIFTGYVSEENVLSGNLLQLVGGVIWILRNGTGFVNVSKKLECEKTEETGPMDHFINILSARSAVGHDEDGNVIIVQVDGKSGVDGINLNEMETLLQQLGVVNAINLDGGGSSTLVINGTTANYPYDACDDQAFTCDRKVSTVLCVHSPYCDPYDCNKHGACSVGECICEKNWLPPKCDQLFCSKNNCSNRGICTNEGCICHPGYFGEDCTESCLSGWYGSMCSKQCDCFNSVGCDPISGSCKCKRGFTGEKCLSSCPVGFFGQNCQLNCQCNNTCFCDPVTGDCEVSFNSSIYKAAKCVARNIIQNENLVKDNVGERRKWYLTMVILGIITAVCLASFLLLMFCSCSCSCQNEQILCLRKEGKQKKKYRLQVPSGYLSDSMSDSETVPMQNFEKS
ncbi:N-acetylglucosamine-1-phosphodiester alpha-N-acetylglucosaminidase-like [Argiope bruennichi]|uniref:N-acetylglucosamine-1-phosphodiester alpha-N-acetylglucosaminidase-like n=1 Tax=Argiope bruennichi TaxID=94029 RepID=UPI0024945BDE|nr:N-acetylglucosamine-1-phosphodiester alpha-N-acetylglucosaminidase-like [Argiope bruennichi]